MQVVPAGPASNIRLTDSPEPLSVKGAWPSNKLTRGHQPAGRTGATSFSWNQFKPFHWDDLTRTLSSSLLYSQCGGHLLSPCQKRKHINRGMNCGFWLEDTSRRRLRSVLVDGQYRTKIIKRVFFLTWSGVWYRERKNQSNKHVWCFI